ncbi:MAG: FtsX-like permease family protein [Terracidiphilus sp.]|nr:FtsX-like permease family protein [Terracidiphilus sp.]MDR3776000.1 FtsX-like permease family protein [Terracidiphilus sp.]
MSKFLLLAFRNIFRNRRRTLMTLMMVGGGVVCLLLAGGYFGFMTHGLRESTINDGLGHIQIFTADHFRRDEVRVLDTGIENWRQVAATVTTGGHVRGVAPRIEFYGMVSNGTKAAGFMGSGVDPAAENSLGFVSRVVSGRDLDAKPTGEVEALIGVGLAKSMNVKVGDGLTLLAMTSDGALNGVDVEIVGLTNSGVAALDARSLRVTLPAAQRLLQSDRVTNLVVGLDATDNTDKVAAELAPRLRGLPQQMELRKWIDLATYYKQVSTMFNGIFLFMGVIVFFMVLMSSVNTLLMSMFERTREIGTMLAMGTPRGWIVALFVLEATLLGVMGAVAGVAAGNLLGMLLNASGLHMPPPPGYTVAIPFRVLHIPAQMIGSSLLVIISLAFASILPAVRASRLQIAEALAHV